MEFQKFSAGPEQYGEDNPSGVQYAPGVSNVNFYDSDFDNDLNGSNQSEQSPDSVEQGHE